LLTTKNNPATCRNCAFCEIIKENGIVKGFRCKAGVLTASQEEVHPVEDLDWDGCPLFTWAWRGFFSDCLKLVYYSTVLFLKRVFRR